MTGGSFNYLYAQAGGTFDLPDSDYFITDLDDYTAEELAVMIHGEPWVDEEEEFPR